ncbi:MAG: LysM peptidoglycan-binding domain-containing protein [Desulfobacterales bacterium]
MKVGVYRTVMLFITMTMVLCGNSYGAKTEMSLNDPFPVYPGIRKAVDFWKKIYSRYTTHQGIIHDDRNLDIIYEIVELENPKNRGAGKRNQNKIKWVKKKYQAVLSTLAGGKEPASKEEKKIFTLFGERATTDAFREAQNRIRFQLGQKDRFGQGIIRSGAYIEAIKAIFRSHDLPEDLAYLPHVESSFDYKAYSKFGAAGIWQFTHSTGKKYMTIDYVQDDRRDPISASHAAAVHLKENYQKLGNWPMAITAYNHGVNGMTRAKAIAGDNFEKILSEYTGRSFGFASRNFYAEFLAAREVARDYQRYFGELTLDAPVKTVEVRLPGYASVETSADYYGTNVETLRKLNPAIREPVFLGQKRFPKGYLLRLPEKTIVMAGSMPKALLHTEQLPSRFYLVQKGDTAGMIAKSHGVKLSDLILANGLGPRARVYVKQNLRIPTPEESILLAAASVKPLEQRSTTAAESRPEKPVEVRKSKPEAPEPKVAEGESAPPSLSLVKTQLPASVPEPEVNTAVVTGDLTIEKVFTDGARTIGIIRVAAEETLGHYADWLGIPTQTIRRLNGFRYSDPIRTNKKIKIPLTKSSRKDFEEKRYEYHKEMEEDFFSVYRIDGETVYTVDKGDNIWFLCRQTFELPFWLIQKYNAAQDFNQLKPGQKIRVPTVQKKMEES